MVKKRTVTVEEPKYYEKVTSIPLSKGKKTGKYWKAISGIAKEPKGFYKIKLHDLGENMNAKKAFPSLEKAIEALARLNGVNTKEKQTIEKDGTGRAKRVQYESWKKTNMQLRVRGDELFIEKNVDKPLL